MFEPLYQGGPEEVLGFALETHAFAVDATSLPSAPTAYASVGYSDAPSLDTNDNPSLVSGAESQRGFGRMLKGRREHTLHGTLRLGSPELLLAAIRPLDNIAFRGGSSLVYDSIVPDPWIARYGYIRDVTVSITPNQPVSAAFEAWPLVVVRSGSWTPGATTAAIETAISAAAGPPVLWQHIEVTINGQSYRDIFSSLTLKWTHNMERMGMRPDTGDDDPLSRTARYIRVKEEAVSIEANLDTELPAELARYASNSSIWSDIRVVGKVNNVQRLAIQIDAGYLARSNKTAGQPSRLTVYGASVLGRAISIQGAI